MKSEGMLKTLAWTLLLAVGFYFVAFTTIEHFRNRNGPWQVAFTHDEHGDPALEINQLSLELSNVLIVFQGFNMPTNLPETNPTFAQPHDVPFDVPYGKCLFMDTMSLPGTVVFELFGHQVQLMPLTLTIDSKSRAWKSGARILLSPEVKVNDAKTQAH